MRTIERRRAGSGQRMYALLEELYPLCRSITGDGVRETLRRIGRFVPLEIVEVPSGTRAFDWTVPDEWNVREAWIEGPDGRRVVDFADHNLHVVGYSVPVDVRLSREELEPHLHSLPDQPDAVPYVTSYYQRRWGFCLTDRLRRSLPPGEYRCVIDSDLQPGSLTYGECVFPGETEREVFLSTYVCHPSMANNELSGPVVAAWLARWVARRPRRYTYRFVFAPETIGALVYLSRHLDTLKRNVDAGYVITCVGDERAWSYLPSRAGDTLADRVARHVLRHTHPEHLCYRYLDRGSDERQYDSPGVDLPMASIMRSKYGAFPEYHTSHDDLSLVTPRGLEGSYLAYRRCLETLDANVRYRATCLGEPQLGRRGLYPTLSSKGAALAARVFLDVLAYADGENDLLAIAEHIDRPCWEIVPAVRRLLRAGLLAPV